MAKKERKFVFLSDWELAVYLLARQKELESSEHAGLALDKRSAKEAEISGIIKRIEADFDLENVKGSLTLRIDNLIGYLCDDGNFDLEAVKDELEVRIEKGVVEGYSLEELEKSLTLYEAEVKEIRQIAREIAKKSVLPSDFVARVLRQINIWQSNSQIETTVGDGPTIARAYAKVAGVVVEKVLTEAQTSTKISEQVGKIQEVSFIKQLLEDPKVELEIKAISREIPLFAQPAFLRSLKQALPSSVARVAMKIGVGLSVREEIQKAAFSLAKQGIPLEEAQREIESLIRVQSVVLRKEVLNTPALVQKEAGAASPPAKALDLEAAEVKTDLGGEEVQEEILPEEIGKGTGASIEVQGATLPEEILKTTIFAQERIIESLDLVAAKMVAQTVEEQIKDPTASSKTISQALADKAETIVQEVGGVSKESGREVLERIIKGQAKASSDYFTQSLKQRVSLQKVAISIQKKYNLSPEEAQRTVILARDKTEQIINQAFWGTRGVGARALRGVALVSANFTTAAALQGIPDNPRKTPVGKKAEFRKTISFLLRQAGVAPHEIRRSMFRIESFLPASLHKIRFEANRNIVYSALEKATKRLGIKTTSLPDGEQPAIFSSPGEKEVVYQPESEKVALDKEVWPEDGANFPSSKLLASEVIQVLAEEADPNINLKNKEDIGCLAVVVYDRVRLVAPQTNFKQVEQVLVKALITSEEAPAIQSALLRISADYPSEEIEFLAEERKELYLEQLEATLGEKLSPDEEFIADFLFAVQTKHTPSFYQLPVSREQIPERILGILEEGSGEEKAFYLYEDIVRVINSNEDFTSEDFENAWPLVDDEGRLTFRGALKVAQDGEADGTDRLSQLSQLYENLSETQKQKFGWLKNVLDQESKIAQMVTNNPIYKFRQKLTGFKTKLVTSVGDWAVRTFSFGRLSTVSALKTVARNWFLQTGVGKVAQSLALKASQKVAEFVAKEGVKKLLSSAAVKAIAGGLTAVLGVSTGGISLLIQAGVMALGWVAGKVAGLGKKLLKVLGIDSSKIEGWFKKNIPFVDGLLGKAATGVGGFAVAVVGGLLAVPVISGAVLLALVAIPIFLAISLSFLVSITTGSAQRMSMVDERGGLLPEQINLLAQGEDPQGDSLAANIQRALASCDLNGAITADVLRGGASCLTDPARGGLTNRSVNAMIDSADRFDYLQCVGFVRASVFDLPPIGNASDFARPPASYPWQPLADRSRVQVGQIVVWDRGLGHMGVITKVESAGPDGTQKFLWVTQAWGDEDNQGVVTTTKILVNEPDVILEFVGEGAGGGGGGFN